MRELAFDPKLEVYKTDKEVLELVHQCLANIDQQAGIDGTTRVLAISFCFLSSYQ
jgi:hypothetical protein